MGMPIKAPSILLVPSQSWECRNRDYKVKLGLSVKSFLAWGIRRIFIEVTAIFVVVFLAPFPFSRNEPS